MALVKIYSGSEVMVLALTAKLQEAGIEYLVKNNTQSAIAAGFGVIGTANELFVDEANAEKANSIVKDFNAEI